MIKLSESKGDFRPIDEGVHVFKVVDAEYDKDFGIIDLHMVTKEGKKHKETFKLLSSDGSINEGALNAFSYTARVLLDDFSIEVINHEDLIGRYIKCEVTHNKVPSTKVPGEFITFVNLNKKYVAKGFENEDEVTKEKPTTLDDLLS